MPNGSAGATGAPSISGPRSRRSSGRRRASQAGSGLLGHSADGDLEAVATGDDLSSATGEDEGSEDEGSEADGAGELEGEPEGSDPNTEGVVREEEEEGRGWLAGSDSNARPLTGVPSGRVVACAPVWWMHAQHGSVVVCGCK